MKAFALTAAVLLTGLITVDAGAAEAGQGTTTSQAHINLSAAEKLSAAAQAHARAKGFNLVFVVIDASGNTVLVSRMDGASPLLTDVARRKAVTALMMQQPSGDIANPPTLGTVKLLGIQDVLPVRGGIPLRDNGRIVGAMGASGAPAEEDEAAVIAAVTAVLSK
ncbi:MULTISPECIES: heme-binding protein [Asticcacaulis]|uniref:GlcG/HbpS family heme-binding protein n=1 Tax=Asticcacaulis TaxID=76890 RepID=UPI001AE64364|nr:MULTISPECIES: heme-binding protein [Asticcacaulis]MBP2160364.1 uncharacterized protein GlcG (DUF336 family) [Asticcacaulis solisilvae]MDR6801333.1 uncharacterized protein GlcG (DUF336 family) [Asticcacaulis sp. BE141]